MTWGGRLARCAAAGPRGRFAIRGASMPCDFAGADGRAGNAILPWPSRHGHRPFAA
ncbi:hypothetical protein C7S14_3968 [Burkholderia cepacia]|nr:hypothetical protein C7S14_3968 [Burkholderia cepacia]